MSYPRRVLRVLALGVATLFTAACSEQADPVSIQPADAELELPTAMAHEVGHELVYTVSWDGGATAFPVQPVQRAMSVQDYYSYGDPDGAAANTPDDLEKSDMAQLFLYEDTNTGDRSLVVIMDEPGDGSGLEARVLLTGIPVGADFVVRDDPGETPYAISDGAAELDFNSWDCCTDGFALGPLAGPFEMAIDFATFSGLDSFAWVQDENGSITRTAIPAQAVNSISLTAAYPNEAPEAVAAAPAVVELDGGPTAEVTLDGSASSDADGDALTYTWTEDGAEVATGASPTVSLGLGTHTITLEVDDGVETDTDQVTVEVVDPTAPLLEAVLSGTEGDDGWYTTPVEVSWTVTELESPSTLSTTGCEDATAGEGTSTFSCAATSAGGEGSDEVTVKVDSEAPIVAFTGNAGTYDLADEVAITCTATDDGSGIATADCPDATGDAWTFGVGTTTLEASATDEAGNSTTATTAFEVVADVDAVSDLIESWVGNRGVANGLAAKLRTAHRASERGNGKAAAGAIRAFENQVRAVTGPWLTQAQADFLLALY